MNNAIKKYKPKGGCLKCKFEAAPFWGYSKRGAGFFFFKNICCLPFSKIKIFDQNMFDFFLFNSQFQQDDCNSASLSQHNHEVFIFFCHYPTPL